MVEHEGVVGDEQRLAKQGVLLEVNRRIHEAVLRLDAAGLAAVWAFMCECGAWDCQTEVPLTLAGYEGLRIHDEPVLADGHALSRAVKARRDAARLRDDAEALQSQARHQTGRARKNLRKPGG